VPELSRHARRALFNPRPVPPVLGNAAGRRGQDGWNSEAVKEALDTCLSCKGCRSDCPTHTDIASWKAEFLSHYHEQHRRPRQALSMGRIGDWARLAGKAPWLANFPTQTPGLSTIAKRIAGAAPERQLPRFASAQFRKRADASAIDIDTMPVAAKGKVILWVDTFCENFHPEIASAATQVLRHAGFAAILPKTPLCCGRPLYDFGYLDLAREKLRHILDAIGDDMMRSDSGVFGVVGLEPGCMSVFKDELLKMFPDDPRAQRLAANTWLLGDFLVAQDYVPPIYEVDVLVRTHCHQKSLLGIKGDQALMERMGARAHFLDSGCCGMAGSFGFNPAHIEISKAVGEEVLLPVVRKQAASKFILANGFSCREQIRQGTSRQVVHLAELLLLAHESPARQVSTGGAQAD
jgi:Fe-S oxidoreductase